MLDYLDDQGLRLLLEDLMKIKEKTWSNVAYIREEELEGIIVIIKDMLERRE